MNIRLLFILAVSAIFASACSVNLSIGGADPADASVEIIEGELADIIDLGAISATCGSPESVEVGTTWNCDGVTDAGTIDFLVEVDREDHINVQTENVLLGDQVVLLADSAAESIEQRLGVELAPGALDCGDRSVILPPSSELSCTIDTGNEAIETTITITDLSDTSYEVDLEPLEGAFATDYGRLAVGVIEGELADLIGLGPVMATCDSPPSTDLGTTFDCTGEVAGQVATFTAVINGEDNVNVNTTNVILADQVQTFAVTAMRQLNESVGGSAPDEAMDCGDESIILPANNVFVCGLGLGADIYDATINITDPSDGSFTVVVADSPRG